MVKYNDGAGKRHAVLFNRKQRLSSGTVKMDYVSGATTTYYKTNKTTNLITFRETNSRWNVLGTITYVPGIVTSETIVLPGNDQNFSYRVFVTENERYFYLLLDKQKFNTANATILFYGSQSSAQGNLDTEYYLPKKSELNGVAVGETILEEIDTMYALFGIAENNEIVTVGAAIDTKTNNLAKKFPAVIYCPRIGLTYELLGNSKEETFFGSKLQKISSRNVLLAQTPDKQMFVEIGTCQIEVAKILAAE